MRFQNLLNLLLIEEHINNIARIQYKSMTKSTMKLSSSSSLDIVWVVINGLTTLNNNRGLSCRPQFGKGVRGRQLS